VNQFDLTLPDFLPVLGYGLFAKLLERPRTATAGPIAGIALSALLSKVLLAITLEFELQWPISLAVSLNGVRVMNEDGVALRDLPRLSGVSKEAIGFLLTFLRNEGYVEIVTDTAIRRTKLVRLTPKGLSAQVANRNRLAAIETKFNSRFGVENVETLEALLRDILGRREGDQPVLAQGLIPHPGCWRLRKPYVTQTLAMLEDPVAALPHYPMVLHRGGYPDGS
jgi:DNA-binding MarR family transcriptional regulator